MVDILYVVEGDGKSVALGTDQLFRFLEVFGLLVDEATPLEEVLKQFLDALANGIFDLANERRER